METRKSKQQGFLMLSFIICLEVKELKSFYYEWLLSFEVQINFKIKIFAHTVFVKKFNYNVTRNYSTIEEC